MPWINSCGIAKSLLHQTNHSVGTLMSSPLDVILSVKATKEYDLTATRIKKIWELLSSRGGLPTSIVFLDNQRLLILGWLWAPASLLNPGPSKSPPKARQMCWRDPHVGSPVARSLAVQYPDCPEIGHEHWQRPSTAMASDQQARGETAALSICRDAEMAPNR